MSSDTMLHHARLLAGIAIAALVMSTAAPLCAQQAVPTISAGTRIRIAAPSAGIVYRARGVVDSATTGLLFVSNLTEPPSLRGVPQVRVPMPAITRLDVRTGERSRASSIGTGALIGLAAGALIPIGFALATGSFDDPDSWGWAGVALGAAYVVPWTSAIGAAVGALVSVDRWQQVIPSPR